MRCFFNRIQDTTLQIQICVMQFVNSLDGTSTVAYTGWHENVTLKLQTKFCHHSPACQTQVHTKKKN